MKYLATIVLSICFFFLFFRTDDYCLYYKPFLFNDIVNGPDTSLAKSFVLVNLSLCDRSHNQELITYVKNQKPAAIVLSDTLNGIEDRSVINFGYILDSSLLICDNQIVKFKSPRFISKLKELNFEVGSNENESYVNYFSYGFNYIPIVDGCDFELVDYRNKIVVLGSMGSSDFAPVFDQQETIVSTNQFGILIYKSQLLSVILFSLIEDKVINDLPLLPWLSIFISFAIALLITLQYVLKLNVVFPLKYLIVKVAQALFIAASYFCIILLLKWNYVLDDYLLLFLILVQGEVLFWTFFARQKLLNR